MIARAPNSEFSDRVDAYRSRVNQHLATVLADDDTPKRLRDAMEYSVLGNGKRVRPLLVYAAAELAGVETELCDSIAAAVELVHAYSLIHDDLPAMDDDDLRRGRPTTHKAFDEATAILAGDALQALAFEILCIDPHLSARAAEQSRIVGWLARAIGPAGMVGGQALDLEGEQQQLDEAALENIHRRKTGQLIRAAIMMPSELSDLPADASSQLDRFANDIGLVFQIRDDLLEVEQDTATLGKSAASDAANDKSTYPSVLGVDGARKRADEIYARALEALHSVGGNASGLEWISEFILRRSH
ncbi:MAG: polyprenyl synthetase family protein [Gammaproteobacteria bacterium]|nr:polyprenyl synthetase family protein [Gammaproteobacteria bacterium]